MTLKLGLPSKGRLMEQSFDWFSQRGITLSHDKASREYAAEASGVDGLQIVLLSAGEIPRELAAGRIQLGVTGTDLVREKLPLWSSSVTPLVEMGFGHADLIIAVPDFWADVRSLDDLDAVAAQFRARHGMRLRIATKYHRLVRTHLTDNGVADYQIVDSQGATEGTIKNLTAEAIADITTTGETLQANHLRVLDGAPILRSQATLFASRKADWSALDTGFSALLKTLGLPYPSDLQ
ncbi:MAG: ATP phosphoribosyltransferase [Pseudomonadota bacterium]